MTKLGIVADDVTGGTTVGALLARKGAVSTLYYEFEHLDEVADPAADTVIVSTNSRTQPAREAFDRVRQTTFALRRLGVSQFSKRIDTTLRGGIGPEVEGMLNALEDNYIAVVVPAMPQSKKVVVGGYSLIDSTLLAQTGVAQDVRTPVRESYLPKLLQEQFSEKVGYIPLETVMGGEHEIASMMRRMLADGTRVFVFDSATLEQIDDISCAVIRVGRPVVAVDPGPFTVSLALLSGTIVPGAQIARDIRENHRWDDEGTVFVVAGSATEVTKSQMKVLTAEPGTKTLLARPLSLISHDSREVKAEMARLVAETQAMYRKHVEQPRVLVLAVDIAITGAPPATREELESASGLEAAEASNLLTRRLGQAARLVADVVTPKRCSGFYLSGGDTMVKVCQALGGDGLKLVDYVIPQVDQSVLVGGPYDGIPVVCKGGLTGKPNTAVQAVNRLFDEHRMMANGLAA